MHIHSTGSDGSSPILNGKTVASDHLPIYGYTDNYAGTGHSLSLLSWNISYCDESSGKATLDIWHARLPAIVDTIVGQSQDGTGPDLINLQEISPMQRKDLQAALENDPRTQGKYGFLENNAGGPNDDSLVTLYDRNKLTPTGATDNVHYTMDKGEDRRRSAFMNQFSFNDNPSRQFLDVNIKGAHYKNDESNPAALQADIGQEIADLNRAIQTSMSNHKISGPVLISGDCNNEFTAGALAASKTNIQNHSKVSSYDPKVDGGRSTLAKEAWADATQNGYIDNSKVGQFHGKVDDQILSLTNDGTDWKDSWDASVAHEGTGVVTTLYQWGTQPPPPPPLTPELQTYETNLNSWLQQYDGGAGGYINSHFIEPLFTQIASSKPPMKTVADVKAWLGSSQGKSLMSGLLSANIYSADSALSNMDPAAATAALKTLFSKLGISGTVPAYPTSLNPPTPGFIDHLKTAMQAWAGSNPPYGKSGKVAFDEYLMSYIQKNNITSAADLSRAMPDLLKTDDPRGIYFKCPGLSSADLASAFSVMGLSSTPAVPPMDNLDKSLCNVTNYCNTHTKDATHYMKPFYALRDFLSQNVNITESGLKTFLNGTFRKDPGINFKMLQTVPAYQKQLQWFSTANLPDWV